MLFGVRVLAFIRLDLSTLCKRDLIFCGFLIFFMGLNSKICVCLSNSLPFFQADSIQQILPLCKYIKVSLYLSMAVSLPCVKAIWSSNCIPGWLTCISIAKHFIEWTIGCDCLHNFKLPSFTNKHFDGILCCFQLREEDALTSMTESRSWELLFQRTLIRELNVF